MFDFMLQMLPDKEKLKKEGEHVLWNSSLNYAEAHTDKFHVDSNVGRYSSAKKLMVHHTKRGESRK